MKRCEDERNSLLGCEARYDTLLQEKTLAVKAAGGPTAEKILQAGRTERLSGQPKAGIAGSSDRR